MSVQLSVFDKEGWVKQNTKKKKTEQALRVCQQLSLTTIANVSTGGAKLLLPETVIRIGKAGPFSA